MKDTPIQKAIAELENKKYIGVAVGSQRHKTNLMINEHIAILQSLLPYERDCIEGAYDAGFNAGALLSDARAADYDSAQDYFTNTFKQ